jgi:hypothetical protein
MLGDHDRNASPRFKELVMTLLENDLLAAIKELLASSQKMTGANSPLPFHTKDVCIRLFLA